MGLLVLDARGRSLRISRHFCFRFEWSGGARIYESWKVTRKLLHGSSCFAMSATENEINDEAGETESDLLDRIRSLFGGTIFEALQSKYKLNFKLELLYIL